jgi:hypothetical protein
LHGADRWQGESGTGFPRRDAGVKDDTRVHVDSGGLSTASSAWLVALGPPVRGQQLSRSHEASERVAG